MPIKLEIRRKWDEILSKYQQTNGTLICMEHFNPNDYTITSNRCDLKKGAVPSIFESSNINIVTPFVADLFIGNTDVANVAYDENDVAYGENVVRTDITDCST